jgi:type VI secretion system ImpM family protein
MKPAFQAGPVGIFGKSRHQAEFLRVRGASPALSAFDAWVTDATEFAAARAGQAWPEAFRHGAIQAFAYHPSELPVGELVCGALGPSADSAGRQFPLIVAAPLRLAPELHAAPELLPFVLEAFWARASALLAQIQSPYVFDLHAAASTLETAADISVQAAQALYDEWTRGLPLHELWALLGPPLDGTEVATSLRLLAATVEPFRRAENPTTKLSLRLPLGQTAGVGLCFWIDLVKRHLGWKATTPSFFWSHDGNWGSAILHLGQAPRITLAELFMPSGQRDEVCDLTQPLRAGMGESLPPLAEAATHALGSGVSTVNDLLATLHPA